MAWTFQADGRRGVRRGDPGERVGQVPPTFCPSRFKRNFLMATFVNNCELET